MPRARRPLKVTFRRRHREDEKVHAPPRPPRPPPEALQTALVERYGPGGVQKWSVEAMLVEAARQGLVSRRKAATLLGIETGPAKPSSSATA